MGNKDLEIKKGVEIKVWRKLGLEEFNIFYALYKLTEENSDRLFFTYKEIMIRAGYFFWWHENPKWNKKLIFTNLINENLIKKDEIFNTYTLVEKYDFEHHIITRPWVFKNSISGEFSDNIYNENYFVWTLGKCSSFCNHLCNSCNFKKGINSTYYDENLIEFKEDLESLVNALPKDYGINILCSLKYKAAVSKILYKYFGNIIYVPYTNYENSNKCYVIAADRR